MRPPLTFVLMLGLAAAGAFAVLWLTEVRSRPLPPSWPVATATVPPAPDVAAAAFPSGRPRFLAGHPATLALGHALAAGTSVDVLAAWPAGVSWSEQTDFARGSPGAFAAAARAAPAVITLRAAAPGDALFAAARAVNPRVVELDVTVAADQRTSVVRLPAGWTGGQEGAAFALAPGNAARLAERLAAEFAAWVPTEKARFERNLAELQGRLFRLRTESERALAEVEPGDVVVFTAAFDALLEEFALPVAGRFEDEEAAGKAPERGPLVARLRATRARVSVHAWPPGEGLRAALAEAGVRPVVLNAATAFAADHTLVPGEGDYFEVLSANVTRLIQALEAGRGEE